jgi:NADH-quinone oxidoreductase subunit D
MLGIEVPERAVWARTLLGELGRVLSHLMFLGGFPLGPDEGGPALLTAALREREAVQRLMEEVSGGRMHYMLNRVGGLKEDLPNGWEGRARAVVAGLRGRLPTLVNSLLANDSFGSRTRGIGVLAPEHVLAYGVSGPIARASGVAMDLRLDEPYLAYDRVGGALRMVTRPDGDAYARFDVLAEQTSVSLDIADACLDALAVLAPGPVNVKLPKVVRAPEGATYAWTENPLGLNGYYLVSRGEKTPWRLKLRSASFNNVQVLPYVLRGLRVDQVAAVVASMFAITGDIDK